MTFEDAAEIIHKLSDNLGAVVDIESDLALVGSDSARRSLEAEMGEVVSSIEETMLEMETAIKAIKAHLEIK